MLLSYLSYQLYTICICLPSFFLDDDHTFWHYCEKSNQTFKFVLRDLVMP